jgi:hypothetical protein
VQGVHPCVGAQPPHPNVLIDYAIAIGTGAEASRKVILIVGQAFP